MNPKKILIVSYYWPPAGGPGVQRWLKFTKYLPDFGWKPTVFIPENPNYPILDESLEKEVSSDLEIIKTKIWEPYGLAERLNKNNKKYKAGQFDIGKNQSWISKLSVWIRGNFFIPDARVFWVKPSIKYLKQYLKRHHFDALVTTGPPHSLHLIGLGLKKEFPNLHWIADFRDPWTEISYYKHLKLTRKSDKKHRELEQQVFENADITLATSFTDADNFRKKGANSVCITNGFDELDVVLDFENDFKTNCFTLSYVGVLEQLRNPNSLWLALDELVRENESFAKDFQLKFVGRVDDKIINTFKDLSISHNINNLGYLSHDKALKEMQNSDILLITNFPNENSKGIIPGKIFEYLATGKKIISFGPNATDVSKILNETQAGKHFGYDEKDTVKNYILSQYKNWKSDTKPEKHQNIEQFSRKNLTEKLVKVLDSF